MSAVPLFETAHITTCLIGIGLRVEGLDLSGLLFRVLAWGLGFRASCLSVSTSIRVKGANPTPALEIKNAIRAVVSCRRAVQVLWCGVGERCRCCGAALVSGVGIDCAVLYVSGIDVVVYEAVYVSGVSAV